MGLWDNGTGAHLMGIQWDWDTVGLRHDGTERDGDGDTVGTTVGGSR